MNDAPAVLTPALAEAVDDEVGICEQFPEAAHWRVPVLKLFHTFQATEITVDPVQVEIPGRSQDCGRYTHQKAPRDQTPPVPDAQRPEHGDRNHRRNGGGSALDE